MDEKLVKVLPQMNGEFLYIPFVGAIIERVVGGEKQVLVQTREKKSDPKYSGSLEIPGGKFRANEDVYETLKREVKEECGLDITNISGQDKRKNYINRKDSSDIIEPFCVTQMANGPFIGIIFLCKAEGKLLSKTNETKDSQWIGYGDLKEIVDKNPERIYTAFLAPLKKYFNL